VASLSLGLVTRIGTTRSGAQDEEGEDLGTEEEGRLSEKAINPYPENRIRGGCPRKKTIVQAPKDSFAIAALL